jgi:hypothetical protein
VRVGYRDEGACVAKLPDQRRDLCIGMCKSSGKPGG